MQKFLITDIKDGFTLIQGQDARHICRVLRLKSGDTIHLTTGDGMDYRGCILTASPERIEIRIKSHSVSDTESNLHLTVCCALLKDKKMDLVIKHLAQLGVNEWVPFLSERAVPRPNLKQVERRLKRWETIAKESMKQCRRSSLVTIHEPVNFTGALKLSAACDWKIAFWENAQQPLGSLVKEPDKGGSGKRRAAVLIGPEGGFTPQEVSLACSNGFSAYSLGPRILRAETAAITSAALVQHILGDM